MRIFTPTSVSLARVRVLSLVALVYLVAGSAFAAAPAPTYSNAGAGSVTNFQEFDSNGILRDSGVRYPERAGDEDLQNFATLNTPLGIASFETIRMRLNGAGGVRGDRAGVLVSSPVSSSNLVNLNALGVIRLVTYNGTEEKQTVVVSAAVAKSLLNSNGAPTQLEFVASTPFTAIELQVGGLATLSYKLNVHYAYAVPSLVQKQARGLISRFTGGDPASRYDARSTDKDLVTVCVGADVNNPERTVDDNLDNYATFSSTISVSCPAALKVKLEGAVPAPAGYYAGFVIGSEQVLDLSVLSALRITTYLNGVRQETAIDPSLLEIKLLPDGKAQVSFPTSKEFNEVKMERVGVLSALEDMRVYYGFAVEPRAILGTTQVLSNFPSTTANQQHETDIKLGLLGLCVGCNVANPEFATDAAANNSATMTMPVATNAELSLKMNLNGKGVAGNRAGVTLGTANNLIDLALLDQMTVTTYDDAGKVLESVSGSSLLSLNLLPGGKQELSFLTTRDFSSVELTLSSGVSVFNTINVFNAFADDRTGALPSVIVPLPVELSAFGGKWVNGVVELTWATASEKNSDRFVVERSTGKDAGFVSVGEVKSVGNSSSSQTYRLRDADAGTQGVALLYYRLRQVDVDGKQTFSPVISLAVDQRLSTSQFDVYPNPATDAGSVMIRFQNMPAGSTVQTYSQLGQLVSQMPVSEAGAMRLALPAALAPGLYYVVLRGAAGQTLATQRLAVEGR